MALTPDKLRSYHRMATTTPRTTTWAPIMASDCATLADALEIADSCARAEIECSCRNAGPRDGGGWWWNTRHEDPNFADDIAQGLRYLEARGLLVRKPGEPHIVSFNSQA